MNLSEYIPKYLISLEIPLTLMWWTGNSCCLIGFCDMFYAVHCGVLAPRGASIFTFTGLTWLRDSACRWRAQCVKAQKQKKWKFVSAAHNGSYTHSHVFTFSLAVGSLRAWLCTLPSVYSCFSWWKKSPGRRVHSSESWRAEKEINEQVWRATVEKDSGRKWSQLHNTGPRGLFITMDSVCECVH